MYPHSVEAETIEMLFIIHAVEELKAINNYFDRWKPGPFDECVDGVRF
jgi:hypothetical protein